MGLEVSMPPFPPTTFEARMRQWFAPVLARESGIVLFPVRLDRLRRTTQFLRDTELQKNIFPNSAHIRFSPISVSGVLTTLPRIGLLKQLGIIPESVTESSLDGYFYGSEKQTQFVFIITDPDGLYCREREWILSIFNDLAYQYRNISIIQLLEHNVLHPTSLYFLETYASLFNHVAYAPLYNQAETEHYTRYICQYFGIENPFRDSDYADICMWCGGHPWLVKEVVRFYLHHPSAKLEQALHHEELDRMVEVIWQGMTESEQNVIRSIATGMLSDRDQESEDFLQKIGLISQKKCSIRFLSDRAKQSGIRAPLVVSASSIHSNGVDVTHYFTDKERAVLTILHKSLYELVSRETIGQAVWGEEGYSDWALDRLIARIRRKLTNLGFATGYIETVPQKGFRIHSI